MQYPRTIRNFNAFIDGVSYAGRATEAKLPELKLQTAAHRGGGMDAPTAIDMGMEAMRAEVTLAEWSADAVTLIGNRKRLVLRPVALGETDFEATSIVATIGGRWSGASFADLKPGTDTPVTLTLEADYVRMVMDGVELFEIDVLAGKRVINGTDQLKSIRAAMGF